MGHSLLVAAVLAATLAAVPGPAEAQVRRTPREAADAALDRLAAVGPELQPEGLGSAGPGAKLRTGKPIPEALVRLDELKAHAPGSDASKLVHRTGAYLVPVMSGAEVVSSVTVARQGQGYAMVAAGDSALARAIARSAGGGGGTIQLVRIPALHLAFIARGAGRSLVLMPLSSDARARIEEAKAERASAIFERLAPVARQVPSDVPG